MPITVTGTWGRNSTDTYQDGEDTYIRQNAATTNYGSSATLLAGETGSSNIWWHILLRFTPFNQIPYMSDIIDARLFMYTLNINSNPHLFVRRVLQPWVEDEATWNLYNYSTSWNTVGVGAADDSGEDDGVYDRHATIIHDAVTAAGTWSELDVTSLVQQWVNSEAKEYGLFIQGGGSSSSNTVATYESCEGNDGFRPYLRITYSLRYNFNGTVLDQGVPAVGWTVVAHKRDTFEPMGSTTTSGDGGYNLITTYSGSHYIVCLDQDGGVQYNDKILGLMTPEEF